MMSGPSHLQPVSSTGAGFADFFDELPLWSAPFALKLLERVPLVGGSTILDIGCGTGFLSIELAQRCGPASRVYAVDPGAVAMERLARKLAFYQIANVELVQKDAVDTGLPTGCADLIVSNLGINNFDDPDAVLGECFRLARPGACLMLTTNLTGHMHEVYAAYRDVLSDLGLAERLPALDAQEAHRGTVKSTRARLARAGFSAIAEDVGTFSMRFADGSALLRHWFVRLGFVQGWRSIVDAADAGRVFEALEHQLNTIAGERGELALTIPVALFDARR